MPDWLQGDPRWNLTQRVVAGTHFARSPLLTKFLLFVVAETLEGRGNEITEHQIGVQVFDRPADYRTLEDNIVRSYARQLRKRLAEHFADQGSSEPVRIDIPVGAYVPVFLPVAEDAAAGSCARAAECPAGSSLGAESRSCRRRACALAPMELSHRGHRARSGNPQRGACGCNMVPGHLRGKTQRSGAVASGARARLVGGDV